MIDGLKLIKGGGSYHVMIAIGKQWRKVLHIDVLTRIVVEKVHV